MMEQQTEVEFLDLEPRTNSMLTDVLMGLSSTPKCLSPKYLYDKRGSEIFEEICLLEEYYPTRAETEIFSTHGKEITSLIGPGAMMIEPGSGSGEKIRTLLKHLKRPSGYVPLEISKDILLRMTDELHHEHPALPVFPICADFMEDVEMPELVEAHTGKKVVFFPGSTIGNLAPTEALGLLKKFSKLVGHGGGLLIGVDLKKEKAVLERAYDDAKGVTAAFNLNLLTRLNRELDAKFEVSNFKHLAVYNEDLGRIEMHLRSLIPQMVQVNESMFRFNEGETIHTENSYKYSVEEFTDLAGKAKFNLRQTWQDKKQQFCVYYFERD
jgi:dimethylhistidine N-methyltransferase